ncbi:MAG: glycine cleavage system aminomethyltransferase GcvT [Anaerolineaceae bacterium]|jgi:glycine hydroxymethyltransferase
MNQFLFNQPLPDLDSDLSTLAELEGERQARRLIMIPSESTAPMAVRQLLASSFTNIYAEGYPRAETRTMTQDLILDYAQQLGTYRRYSDLRYYKGVEYVDIIESLARRRAAELFATNSMEPDDLYVNVQPLSGAPANNAVYTALIQPGDTILGMDLLHGGHLTHGSPVNRSGLFYKAVHYTVDPETEKLNYDSILKLAEECQPKIIIAGYSSYPWIPDWQKFREIADSIGAFLLADVSHIAGLIAAGVCSSPIGIADVVTFTTHKTLCGPRGAVIISQNREIGERIDKGVFPGEQGGPHINTIAAMALTFKLAGTEQFKQLQIQTLKNTATLAATFQKNGVRVPYQGTNSHLTLIDCKSFRGPDGVPLNGDLAARILDLVGIVVNRNTIPGDRSALTASGVRMGTTWLTQRGFVEQDFETIAHLITDLFRSTTPYLMCARAGKKTRAKVDFNVLTKISSCIRDLADTKPCMQAVSTRHSLPHYFFIDDKFEGTHTAFEISGEKVRSFLGFLLSSDIEALQPGNSQPTRMHTTMGDVEGVLTCQELTRFILTVPSTQAGLAGTWINGISSGFVWYDQDLCHRIPGPVSIILTDPVRNPTLTGEAVCLDKPYFVGIPAAGEKSALPEFSWQESADQPLKRTTLYDTHTALGAKIIPFAGWELPVWYSSVLEEHNATRTAAGLFDVTHMGVFQAEGPDASLFLDSVCSNDIISLRVGESLYTHFMDPHANVIDDLLVYRRGRKKYLVVVNAANEAKDWAWLNAVREGTVLVDPDRPWVRSPGRHVNLRNLKDPKEGADRRVDIALQGPLSRDILLKLAEPVEQKNILRLDRTQLCESKLIGLDVVVSRTGYTGEKMSFELFVHPDKASQLWDAIMQAGEPLGLKPCGLGARDSLRTEAGLPLYGHEMGGDFNLTVSEAGFLPYVKMNTTWFIGRSAFRERERQRTGVVVRFRFDEKGVRMAHHGDPVVDAKGKTVGKVTSCAIDQQGYLTGQAFVEVKAALEGSQIFIYQSASDKAQKAPAELTIGDKVTLPGAATIISRFLKV